MTTDLFIELSRQANEALTAATVIVALSMLLYNLTHGSNDRVARASSLLLGSVTVIYIGDVLVALSGDAATSEYWLRFQWLGIAFTPAALFHLSDSLLATTGLISRGRRRRVVRLLYMFGTVFFLTAVGTDLVIHTLLTVPIVMMKPGLLFGFYVVYFVASSVFAFNNVLRARRRCLTRATHRRMTYLLLALVAPVAGIFPYSLLFSEPSRADSAVLWLLINIGNLGVVFQLIFLAYPLSFFGPRKPDRVIKAELLSFMLRGPVTGIAVLLVILYVPRLSVIGIPSAALMPFIAVAVVMGLQWLYTFAIPFLERKLIYTDEQDQAQQIQRLSRHLLTTGDARQLLEATLAAICDYLRVPSAFVASLNPSGAGNGEAVRIEQSIGPLQPSLATLDVTQLTAQFSNLPVPALAAPTAVNGFAGSYGSRVETRLEVHAEASPPPIEMLVWQSFWLIPLRSRRPNGHFGRLIGVVGVWARSPQPDLLPEEEKVFTALYQRAGRVLDDMRLQEEVFAGLEDILQEANTVLDASEPVRYGNASEVERLKQQSADLVVDSDFVDVIKDALRDYWGGPRLTDARLAGLKVVERALPENEGSAAKAVRALLNRAIEQLRPEGQRSMTMSEWTLYNILDLRFVQGKKVRDVARQLAMSEADLYRKQRVAIEQVAQHIGEIERRANVG